MHEDGKQRQQMKLHLIGRICCNFSKLFGKFSLCILLLDAGAFGLRLLLHSYRNYVLKSTQRINVVVIKRVLLWQCVFTTRFSR